MNAIPVFINNRNWLSTTRDMVERMLDWKVAKPIIIDNASTYPPLLKWYETCPVEVIRREDNGLQLSLLTSGINLRQYEYYAYTDSDLDISKIPKDCLSRLVSKLDRCGQRIRKVGVSLEIRDLPIDSPILPEILKRQQSMWSLRVTDRQGEVWYECESATTLAVYRGDDEYAKYGPALRSDRPYTARHVPWYLKPGDLTEEHLYVIRHSEWNNWMQMLAEHHEGKRG